MNAQGKAAIAVSRYVDEPVVESACECGVASYIRAFNGHLQRAMLADHDDGVFGACDRGVSRLRRSVRPPAAVLRGMTTQGYSLPWERWTAWTASTS
jgi:hypothetical protein